MLCWLDLETDGLDAKQNVILELGIIVTDDDLVTVAQADWQSSYFLEEESVSLEVLAMHKASGLFVECSTSQLTDFMIQEAALTFLDDLGLARGEAMLAGSSVHFDRRFLYEWMPDLATFFHYRHFDVSVFTEVASRWYPEVYAARPAKNAEHRTLADLRESINLLKYYRGAVLR